MFKDKFTTFIINLLFGIIILYTVLAGTVWIFKHIAVPFFVWLWRIM